MSARREFTVYVYADVLQRLREQRTAAYLPPIADEQLVQFALSAGIYSEICDYRQMAKWRANSIQQCLETVPASMRGPEWQQAHDHLQSMRERGVL